MLLINHLGGRISRYQRKIEEAVSQVLASGWVVLGPAVARFESEFAAYTGTAHCVSVGNGTDAIELALRALGVSSGDAVATVANAGMYSGTAIAAIGARPWFMDVDEETGCVPLSEVERALDAGVHAVIVTHLYGRAVPQLERIAEVCRNHHVPLLEDCAQSHGASLGGRRVGSFGDAASFSFYPTKNLGALGDGGAVTTSNAQLAERVRQLRQYGWSTKYEVSIQGGRNSRLDELQAAILCIFLPDLDLANERRRQIAARYCAAIRHPDVHAMPRGGLDDVVHLFVLRCAHRKSLAAFLRQHEIATDVHYPIPDHRQPAFAHQFEATVLPVTECLADQILTIPCYPEMSDADVDRVAALINAWTVEPAAKEVT